jgi:hypothetical protein
MYGGSRGPGPVAVAGAGGGVGGGGGGRGLRRGRGGEGAREGGTHRGQRLRGTRRQGSGETGTRTRRKINTSVDAAEEACRMFPISFFPGRLAPVSVSLCGQMAGRDLLFPSFAFVTLAFTRRNYTSAHSFIWPAKSAGIGSA